MRRDLIFRRRIRYLPANYATEELSNRSPGSRVLPFVNRKASTLPRQPVTPFGLRRRGQAEGASSSQALPTRKSTGDDQGRPPSAAQSPPLSRLSAIEASALKSGFIGVRNAPDV